MNENESSTPVVYMPHPKLKDGYQKFHPTITIDEEGSRSMELGKALENYRPAEENEKHDVTIYCSSTRTMKPYVKMK